MLDTGYWILDTGYLMSDITRAGFRVFRIKIE